MKIRFFISALLLLSFGSVSSQVYFIDTSGVDIPSRDGLSIENAWATLAFATDQISGSNDTIQFGVGDFYETETSYPNSGLTILGIDTSSTHVYADTSWVVSDTMRYENPTDYMIYIQNTDSLTIEGIHFSSQDTSNMPNGVLYAVRSDYISVKNVFVENFRWAGLRYFINNYCTIAYSRFKNCSQYKDISWSGLVRTRYFNYSTIHDNIIESDWGFGYGYKASGHRGTQFYNNKVDVKGSFSIESAHENEYEFEIYNNVMTGTLSLPKSGQQANPLLSGWEYSIWVHDNYLEDSYTIEGPRNHMIISHNHIDIKHPNGRVYTCFGGINSGPVYIHHNVIENVDRAIIWKNNGNIDSIHVFNNTIIVDSTSTAGALVDLGPYSNGRSAYGWTFRNNIVIVSDEQPRNLHWPSDQQAANLTAENNIFINVNLVPESGGNIIEYPDLKYDGIIPSPYYTAICPSGNTVDSGLDLGYEYLGNNPDIGAYEYDPSNESRIPFDTITNALPLTIEIEAYDLGIEGVVYSDDNIKEGDISFRPSDFVDVCDNIDASGGYAVCNTAAGEWLEYSVEITPGLYDIILTRSADSEPLGSLLLSLDGDSLLVFDALTSTGGVSTFISDTIHNVILSDASCSFLRLSMTGDVGHLDKLNFDRLGDIPVLGVEITNCPEVFLIESLDYDFDYITIPLDAQNQNVTWSSSDTSTIKIDSNGVSEVLASSGTAMIYILTEEGNHLDSCFVEIDTSGQTPYNFIPQYIPGHIEAEHYDEGGLNIAYFDFIDEDRDCHNRNDEVDTQGCQDIGGGCNTGWSNAGEWMEYTTINTPGIYTVSARMATNNNDGQITFSIDNNPITTLWTPPSSDGWQDWKTASASGISIPGGKHTLRVYLDEGGFNLNWLEFELEGVCTCNVTDLNCIRSSELEENINTYIGPEKGGWNDSPCNWSKGCLPTICDDVVIPSGYDITVRQGDIYSAYSLIVSNGSKITIENGAILNVISQ